MKFNQVRVSCLWSNAYTLCNDWHTVTHEFCLPKQKIYLATKRLNEDALIQQTSVTHLHRRVIDNHEKNSHF